MVFDLVCCSYEMIYVVVDCQKQVWWTRIKIEQLVERNPNLKFIVEKQFPVENNCSIG